MTAGVWIVDHSDLLVAVWDGRAPRGTGGTADVVVYARRVARPVLIVDPRARRVAAEADVLSARVWVPSNPELEFEMADRSSPEGDSTDRGYSLSQSFFTGPVVGRRVRAAEAAREAASLLARDETRLAEAAAARLFYEALLAQERLGLAREIEAVTGRLVEAVTLTTVGGACGLLAGAIIAWAVNSFTPVPAVIPMWSIFMAIAAAAITGIVFGLFPAVRAARLDPVQALRWE